MNDFKKEYHFHKKAIDKAISRVLESGWYILGKEVERFEKEFAKYIGSKYCIGVANGLEALQIALLALGIGKGDEVITVSNSAVATALAITNTGAKVVFVDIDEYYHLDPVKLRLVITEKTKAIIPVHLFGQIVNIGEILKIAKEKNFEVIEDACQAHGAKFKQKKAGSFGILAGHSFYPTKNLGAYGDGGAITTNSKKLYEKCKMLRNYGQKTRYVHEVKGINSRLDEIHAAILRAKMPTLDKLIEKRKEIAKIYFKELKNIKQIKLPIIRQNSLHSFHLFVVQVENRNELMSFLKSNGIESQIHYPIPIHKQKCYSEYNSITLTNTEKAAGKILSLPINPFLVQKDIIFICNTVKKFYNQ